MTNDILTQYEEDALNPDWASFDKQFKHVQDWRTYIPSELREAWDELTVRERCIAIAVGQVGAQREHWD